MANLLTRCRGPVGRKASSFSPADRGCSGAGWEYPLTPSIPHCCWIQESEKEPRSLSETKGQPRAGQDGGKVGLGTSPGERQLTCDLSCDPAHSTGVPGRVHLDGKSRSLISFYSLVPVCWCLFCVRQLLCQLLVKTLGTESGTTWDSLSLSVKWVD